MTWGRGLRVRDSRLRAYGISARIAGFVPSTPLAYASPCLRFSVLNTSPNIPHPNSESDREIELNRVR